MTRLSCEDFPNSSVLSKQRPFLFLDYGLLHYMPFFRPPPKDDCHLGEISLPTALRRTTILRWWERLFNTSSLRVCFLITETPLTNRLCLEKLFLILFTYKPKVISHCSHHLREPRVDSLISETQPSSYLHTFKSSKFINCNYFHVSIILLSW